MTPEEAHAVNEQTQRAYHVVFGSPDGKLVMADLTAYCFGRKTTFDPDPRVHARNDGRREVLMRIVEFTSLTLEEIYALRGPALPRAIPETEE
jgi:hypothetical protein